ncbi:MAG TPA: DUF5924 family protein, partial [Nannocystis sp.]
QLRPVTAPSPITSAPVTSGPITELTPEMAAAVADLERATDGDLPPTPTSAAGPVLPEGITEQDLAALRRFARVRAFMARHGNKLWYLHSAYALTFGAFVVMYASKGYDNARWMVVLLGLGWLVLILFFRVFGTGPGQKEKIKDTKSRVRFYVMTLILKNLYQSMLFFLVPFYYKTATFDDPNRFFVYALVLLAILSTVDVVFDQVLMRWKIPASTVYFFILFACLNLVLPALLPDTRTLLTQMSAAAIAAVVFFTMHVPIRNLLRPAWVLALMTFVAAAVFATYHGRHAIPPVPMYIATGAVGPSLLADGRLSMQVSKLHESLIQEMHALTDVVIPGGHGNTLHHVWRREGVALQRGPVTPSGEPPPGTVRLRSTLRSFNLPSDLAGLWSIDVVTDDDQLVGRVPFEVIR